MVQNGVVQNFSNRVVLSIRDGANNIMFRYIYANHFLCSCNLPRSVSAYEPSLVSNGF